MQLNWRIPSDGEGGGKLMNLHMLGGLMPEGRCQGALPREVQSSRTGKGYNQSKAAKQRNLEVEEVKLLQHQQPPPQQQQQQHTPRPHPGIASLLVNSAGQRVSPPPGSWVRAASWPPTDPGGPPYTQVAPPAPSHWHTRAVWLAPEQPPADGRSGVTPAAWPGG